MKLISEHKVIVWQTFISHSSIEWQFAFTYPSVYCLCLLRQRIWNLLKSYAASPKRWNSSFTMNVWARQTNVECTYFCSVYFVRQMCGNDDSVWITIARSAISRQLSTMHSAGRKKSTSQGRRAQRIPFDHLHSHWVWGWQGISKSGSPFVCHLPDIWFGAVTHRWKR